MNSISKDDFERWLSLQAALGWTVKNPAAVEKIRAAFRAGATVGQFRQVKDQTDRERFTAEARKAVA